MTTQCAWCFPPGSPGHDKTASHGICRRHEHETFVENQVRGIIGRLRGPEYLGQEAREEIAAQLEIAIKRSRRMALNEDHPEPGVGRTGQGTEGHGRQHPEKEPVTPGSADEVPPAAAPSQSSTDRMEGAA